MPQKVFGLVGPIASGKGTVAKIFEENGYRIYSLSDRIREEIKSRELDSTRDNLNKVSNELRELFGADVLAKKTAEIIDQANDNLVLIDSIRNPEEVKFLKKKFGITIIGITADQRRRYDLFMYRGTNMVGIYSWEDFKKLDDSEFAQDGPHKQQVGETLKLSDLLIENSGTMEDLKSKIMAIISGPTGN